MRSPGYPQTLTPRPIVPARPAAPATRAAKLQGDQLFQRVVLWTLPLWLLGALTVAQAALVIRLVADRWPRGRGANLVVLAWAGIAVSQAFAAILVGVKLGTPVTGLAAAVGSGVSFWIFGALAIAAGAAHQLHSPRIVRAIAGLGGMILLGAAIALLARLAGLQELYLSPAPLGLIAPHSNFVRFYASAAFFTTEYTLGEKMTRLILFFPWATALSLGSLGIVFIALLERHLAWRIAGIAGGLVGVVFSWSRIGIATLLAVSAILAFLRASLLLRLALIAAVLLGLFALPLAGIDPLAELITARHSVDTARAGSSMARDLIYQKSWEGFLNSPWIGNGWIGESVHPKEPLPIGSHSTIYGLLYTGGLPTFAAFAAAMLATFALQLLRLTQTRTREDRRRIETGLALTLCLAAFCPFEQLFSLTLPCFYMFTWIGACVGHGAEPAPKAPSEPVTRLSRALIPMKLER